MMLKQEIIERKRQSFEAATIKWEKALHKTLSHKDNRQWGENPTKILNFMTHIHNGATTLATMTLSITTLSVKDLFVSA